MEREGFFVIVAKATVDYRAPSFFEDRITIATTLEKQFDVGLPVFESDKPMNLLAASVKSENDGVLLIRINMELSDSHVKGYLAFLLGPSSQENLQKSLKVLLDKFGG